MIRSSQNPDRKRRAFGRAQEVSGFWMKASALKLPRSCSCRPPLLSLSGQVTLQTKWLQVSPRPQKLIGRVRLTNSSDHTLVSCAGCFLYGGKLFLNPNGVHSCMDPNLTPSEREDCKTSTAICSKDQPICPKFKLLTGLDESGRHVAGQDRCSMNRTEANSDGKRYVTDFIENAEDCAEAARCLLGQMHIGQTYDIPDTQYQSYGSGTSKDGYPKGCYFDRQSQRVYVGLMHVFAMYVLLWCPA